MTTNLRATSGRFALLFPVLLVLIVVFAAAQSYHPGYIVAQTDVNPPDHIWNQFRQCVLPWNFTQSYLGQASWCFAYSPVLMIHAILFSAFGESIAEMLVLFLPYALAALGAYFCLRTLAFARWIAFAGALCYVFNPYSQAIVGLNNAVPIFTAVFAWVCALVVRGALVPAARRRILAALFATFAFGVSTTAIMPHLLVDLAFGGIVWLALCVYLCNDRPAFLRFAGTSLIWLCVACVWWIVPAVISLHSAQNYRPATVSDNAWTFARASLLNFMRLNPIWLWGNSTYFPEAAGYDANPIVYGSGFYFVFVLVAALATLRGKALRVCAVLGLAALTIFFIGKGPHTPLPSVSTYVMSLPLLVVFQDPAGLIVVATFFLAVVTGFFLDGVARVRRQSAFFAAAVIVICAGVSSSLVLRGVIFHGNTALGPTMYVRIPAYWQRVSEVLDRSPDAGGVLVLPADDLYDPWYTWDYLGADTVPISATARRVLLPGPPFGYFITPQRTALYRAISEMIDAGSPLARAAVRNLGIRYVIFRRDIIPGGPSPSAATLREVFPGAKVRQYGLLTLLDLGQPRASVTVWTNWIAVEPDADAGTQLRLAAMLGDERPRIARSETLPMAAAATESRMGATVDGRHRLYLQGPDASDRSVRVGTPSRAFMAYDQRLSPQPKIDSPFALFGSAPTSAAPATRPLLSAMPEISAFQNPLAFYNTSANAIRANMLVRCRECPVGSRAYFTLGGRVYSARVEPSAEGAFSARFTNVRWTPGYDIASVEPPQGGAIRYDDVYFDARPAVPSRLRDLAAYYPLGISLADRPIISDPFVSGRLTGSNSGFVLYLKSPRLGGPVSCFIHIDDIHPFDLFLPALDCLRRNLLPTDLETIASTTVTGVAIKTPHDALGLIKQTNGNSRLVVRWSSDRDAPLVTARERFSEPPLTVASTWRILDASAGESMLIDAYLPLGTAATVRIDDARAQQLKPIGGGMAASITVRAGAHPVVRLRGYHWRFMHPRPPDVQAFRRISQRRIEVGRVSLDATTRFARLPVQPAAAVRVRTTELPERSLFAMTGAVPANGAPSATCEPAVEAVAFHCAGRKGTLLVFNVAQHWSWVAFQGSSPLRHLTADGWRNAWVVRSDGDVTVVNLLDILTPALAVLTIGILGALVLRARQT